VAAGEVVGARIKLHRRIGATASVVAAAVLAALAAGSAGAVTLKRLVPISGSDSQIVATARAANGTLDLMYPPAAAPNAGLATISIGPSGKVGTPMRALSGWGTTQPGLVTLPDGTLEAFFGAISPTDVSGVWGITSSDDGATWSAPADVSSGSSDEAFDYASELTAVTSGDTPVISMPNGAIVIQKGLDPGADTFVLTSEFDGDASDVDQAVDAATGEVVDGWSSIAGKGGDYLQAVAPTVGKPELLPGQVHDPLVFAARDTGPGVFAPYTTDGTHVRLFRYGGGTVAVGKLARVVPTNLATATGIDGRIWVIWGQDGGADLAVTRSNKAVTRFEPIQRVAADTFSLWRIFGDGRLGPLDLFTDEIANGKRLVTPGLYYGRVLPELSAGVQVHEVKGPKGKVTAVKLTVTVTDAGDPAAGATVAAERQKAETDETGTAKLSLGRVVGTRLTVTVTDPGYQLLRTQVNL
jgi:hypothetical protein